MICKQVMPYGFKVASQSKGAVVDGPRPMFGGASPKPQRFVPVGQGYTTRSGKQIWAGDGPMRVTLGSGIHKQSAHMRG